MANILLIEDDAVLRNVLRKFLQWDGHTVFASASARRGLDFVASRRVDVVVAELALPCDDGLGLIRTFASEAGCPVIALSRTRHSASRGLSGRARTVGASSVLASPFTLADLRATVDELTGATAAA
jgi:DNA-binding response OmpR family regulator